MFIFAFFSLSLRLLVTKRRKIFFG